MVDAVIYFLLGEIYSHIIAVKKGSEPQGFPDAMCEVSHFPYYTKIHYHPNANKL